MKRRYSTFLFALMFLLGFGILVYPTVADQWNTYRQSQLISSYESIVAEKEDEIDYSKEWERAKAYNQSLLPSILPDSFAIAAANEEPIFDWHCHLPPKDIPCI